MADLRSIGPVACAPDRLARHDAAWLSCRRRLRRSSSSNGDTNDALGTDMAMAASGLHAGGTQWHVLSAANVQVSAWDKHVVHTSIVLVTIGRASETATARQPCCIVPCEPVGRASDRTDGAQ